MSAIEPLRLPPSTPIAEHALPRSFYARGAEQVARDALGTVLVHRAGGRTMAVRVVETEAYVGAHDLACHASKGLTRRTATMFGPPGYAYVYLIYGCYTMLNLVTGAEGDGQAVLIRAAEPLVGVTDATNGPGRLTRAMAIALEANGTDLCGDALWLSPGHPPSRVVTTARIGVGYAGPWAEAPLRFYDADSRHVSRR